MTTPKIIPTDRISRNSNAAECVRQADELLDRLVGELEMASEVMSDPFKTSKHLMRSMRLAQEVRTQLYQTGIPKYRQAPLFAVRNPGALK